MNAPPSPAPAWKRWPLITLAALLLLVLVGGLLVARQRGVSSPAAEPAASPGHLAGEGPQRAADPDCEEEPPPESFALAECDGGEPAPDAAPDKAGGSAP